jgi:hypothetical protein
MIGAHCGAEACLFGVTHRLEQGARVDLFM